ncbi:MULTISPECIES: LysR family transcriptional regulator [unclassified Pseudonocardia]|uniref:LysR family transcriptional regulator n=1 Tax=unclassified Pseudonocardia TaxID=2619320 RepID=UPI00094B4FA7|nr:MULTISPECIES: LysR substrate-binding domain-containing protein [unclassified Pseudonocardia]
MELRHLHSFLTLSEELHFGRAARRLHLAQPSLSQQIQRLEQSVGTRLVSRSSHEVALTAAGRAFVTEARGVLDRVERARDTAHHAAAGRAGTVRVGCNLPAAQGVLPRVIARLRAELPDVVVAPREMWTGLQLRALHSGDLDVAMIYGPPADAGLGHQRLLRVPLVALVGDRHPWASLRQVSFNDLRGQPCLLFHREQSPAMYDVLTHTAGAAGFTLDVVDHVEDPVATSIVVAARNVIGFCSAARAAAVCASAVGIRPVTVSLVDPVPTLDLYAVWRSDVDNPLVEEFVRCLRADAPSGPTRTARAARRSAPARSAVGA